MLRMERLQSIDDELRSTPGFKFITRPDLYQYAQVSCISLADDVCDVSIPHYTYVHVESSKQCLDVQSGGH